MKSIKTKLALGLIGAVVIFMGVGFSRVGHTRNAVQVAPGVGVISPERALANFKAALTNLQNAEKAFENNPKSPEARATLEEASEALEETQEAIEGAIKVALGYLDQAEDEEFKALNALIDELEKVSTEAQRLIDEVVEKQNNPSDGNPATSNNTAATPAPAAPGPTAEAPKTNEECGADCDGPDPVEDPYGEKPATPNPEGEAPITGTVSANPFAKAPSISRDLSLINPNPDANLSTARSSVHAPAPTDPNAPLIIPTEDSGIKISRIHGVSRPAINLRDPYINPNPESDGTVSGQTSGTFGITKLPTINPIGPVASSIRKLDSRKLQSSLRSSGSLSR